LLVMAAQARIMTKAETHVSGYTREDGTKVAGHTRETGGPTFAEIARRHEQYAAQHRQHAAKCKPGSVRHGQNIEMAGLHDVASHHAGKVADESLTDKTRDEHAAAHAAVKKALARLAGVMNQANASGGSVITKALAEGKRLILFKKAKPRETGPDLSNLLSEMEMAQGGPAFA
jgi:cytochrome c551/c552